MKTVSESLLLLLFILLLLYVHGVRSEPYNGFYLQQSIVPKSEIYHGGPPRDGIPALTNPNFKTPDRIDWLDNNDRILGVFRNGIAKAYPLKIMNWHEIVNDKIGDENIVITYCPLCYSGMAFKADIDGNHLTFGVSGLLYNSDVLLYDHQTESLWSQIMAKAISGKYVNTSLEQVPVLNTTWGDWRKKYPETMVLSSDTGYTRNYSTDPYDEYRSSENLYFPVKFRSAGYHPKEPVIGIEIKNRFKAYPVSELDKSPSNFSDQIASYKIYIKYDAESQTGVIMNEDCQLLPSVTMYWFAWYTFHPETEIYKSSKNKNKSTSSACL